MRNGEKKDRAKPDQVLETIVVNEERFVEPHLPDS